MNAKSLLFLGGGKKKHITLPSLASHEKLGKVAVPFQCKKGYSDFS